MEKNRKCKIRDKRMKNLRVAVGTVHEQTNRKDRKDRKSNRIILHLTLGLMGRQNRLRGRKSYSTLDVLNSKEDIPIEAKPQTRI